jgi:hypothetical protein
MKQTADTCCWLQGSEIMNTTDWYEGLICSYAEYEELVTSYSEPLPWTNKCLTPQDILEMFGLQPHHDLNISQSVFLNLCPAIVYELDQGSCYSESVAQTQINTTAIQKPGLFILFQLHFIFLFFTSSFNCYDFTFFTFLLLITHILWFSCPICLFFYSYTLLIYYPFHLFLAFTLFPPTSLPHPSFSSHTSKIFLS